jgi:hypothetical protein
MPAPKCVLIFSRASRKETGLVSLQGNHATVPGVGDTDLQEKQNYQANYRQQCRNQQQVKNLHQGHPSWGANEENADADQKVQRNRLITSHFLFFPGQPPGLQRDAPARKADRRQLLPTYSRTMPTD